MALPFGFELEPATPATVAPKLPEGFELETPISQPRPSYDLADIPKAAYENLPASATKFYSGVAQAVLSPVQTLTGLLDIGAGALRNSLPEDVVSFIDQFDASPEAAKRASEAANAVGGMYKDRYGNYEAIKRTFAEDPVGAVADLSSILSGGATATARVAPLASKGLAFGAKATNPLAPVGVAAKVAKVPIKGGGEVFERMFNPKNALYLRSAEGRGPEIVNALRNAQEIVPGSPPTAMQAAADTGVVGFQKMGKTAKAELETQYAAREAQQAEAQLRAVRSVGKTADDITDAELARADVTRPMYKKADDVLSKVDADFASLAERPTMQAAIARAKRLAEDKNIPFEIGKTTPETRSPSAILDAAGNPISESITPAQFADLPGTSIHFIKQALDDVIADPATYGIGKSEAMAAKDIRRSFLEWTNQTTKNPDYLLARDVYARLSKPINQMQVGQFLENKLAPALGEETAQLRAAGYASALKEAPSTIKRATGESRFKALEDIFSDDPQALKVLYDIRSDLARTAKSERLAKGKVRPEVDTARATEGFVGEGLLPTQLNNITTTANALWRKLRGRIDQTTAIEVATEMLTPGKAADALEKAIKQQAKRQARQELLNAPFAATYAAPGTINLLAPQQENRNALID